MKKKILNLAHRGFSGKYPENTLAAFNAALGTGCDGIETDVHMTKDGKLVITHDPFLGRTSNGTGWIKDLTCDELLQVDFGGWHSPEFSGERIMTLGQVFDFCRENNLVCNLEVKNYEVFYKGIEQAILDEIVSRKMQDTVFLSSFNHVSMELCKKLNPEVHTGLLYERPMVDAAKYVSACQSEAVHPSYLMLKYQPELVGEYHAVGKKVNIWTVNEPDDMKEMIALGVDCIISNYPDVLSEQIKAST